MIESREELKDYCLRSLGRPVINIEVDDSQVEDRIDEALQTFQEAHYDGTESEWVGYVITQDDVDNGYITLDDDILTVVDILPMSSVFSRSNIFSYQYQMAISQLSPFQSFSQVDYFMKMTNYQEITDLISPSTRFEHVRHGNKLKIQHEFSVGYPLGMRVYRLIDPTTAVTMWNDKWLKQYTTALIKRQWGENTKKFGNISLLGGVQINGRELFEEALTEIARLEEQLESKYTEPTDFLFG